MEDSGIVELYWQRDEQAIGETDRKYGRYLTKIAHNVLADWEDSRESVNDTYLRAWNSMPPHRPDILSLYLGRITRRLAIDAFRKKNSRRRDSSYVRSLSELEDCVTGRDDPAQTAELHRLSDAITAYLRTLPEETRDVFVCRYYFLDPVRDIAASLGAGESRIKSILYRARLGLRDYLEKEGFDL